MQDSSLWAGMSTVMVTGPAYSPRVSAITSLGASGIRSGSSLRRARVTSRRSRPATPAASSSATPTAASSTRGEGISVS